MKRTCQNPWAKCDGDDIALYIIYKGRKLPICKSCWEHEIAGSKKVW